MFRVNTFAKMLIMNIRYYMWPKNKENKLETLLVGDDLGICHMYNFTSLEWHYCEFKRGSKDQVNLQIFLYIF